MRVIRDIVRDLRRVAGGDRERRGLREAVKMLAYDGPQVLLLTRLREAASRRRIPIVGTVLRRLQVGLFGVEIAKDARLGAGVLFLHTVGVVIGADSEIGDGVLFLGGNTIGSNKAGGSPRIGNDVVIGAGARIIGAITIGDRAVIGANAVVLRDVPAGASAAGVPAVVRQRDERRDTPDPAK